MGNIGKFFRDPTRKRYVAAMQAMDKNKRPLNLYYYESDSLNPIPPSVYVWAKFEENKWAKFGKLMTNYGSSWVSTYGSWESDYRNYERYDFNGNAIEITSLALGPWNQFDLTGLGTKPNLEDIYSDSVNRGLSRARRLYMLAAFCILKKHGRKYYNSSLGHNIGSILVGHDGEVLSWGVNSGGFCHAEVNTICNYFARNPGKSRLPAKSLLFTSLKPCTMCSTLIKNAWHTGSQTKIWYGMMDEGRDGSNPMLGEYAKEFGGEDLIDLDVFELMSENGTLDSATKVSGTKRVLVVPKGGKSGKVDLTTALNRSGGGHYRRNMSAADWTDYSTEVWNLVEGAVTKFKGKVAKERDDGPMKSVLNYLNGWL